ncbi:hypothetical protein TNCV_2679671 [Trichonephila clavipes]|nr:hypothetical protein TNCV_2679671 [Trichonephila clavipes]
MAPGSRFMSGNVCSCRMSWTYLWAVMVPRIKERGDHVLGAMSPHTNTPAIGAVCHCKNKDRIEAFTTRSPNTSTIVITAEIETDLVPFRCSPVSSCAEPLHGSMGGCQGQHM